MKNRLLAIGLTCCATLLFFALLIPLPSAAGLPTDRLVSSPSIPSGIAYSPPATGTLTSTLYLPSIFARPPQLFGYVTKNGQPARDVTVGLFITTLDSSLLYAGSSTTEADGFYAFADFYVPDCGTLPVCKNYYIEYHDPSYPPDLLQSWQTSPITDYVQGTVRQFPTFDIGAPVLISPTSGDVVSPTFTFTWRPRSFPGDNYGIGISGDKGIVVLFMSIDNLGYTGIYTASLVGNNCAGPCSDYYNIFLQWLLKVSNDAGYGYTLPSPTGGFIIRP